MENSLNSQNHLFSSEIMLKLLNELLNNQEKLQNGFSYLSNYEKNRNFYISLLQITLQSENMIKKFSSSILKVFLNKNWSDSEFIEKEEKTVRKNEF